MVTLTVHRLAVKTVIGVHRWEQEQPRTLYVTAYISYNAKKAILTDEVKHAVDYGEVARRITQHLEREKFHLIETVAHTVCKLIISNKKVSSVKVLVEKPKAVPSAEMVSAECSLRR